MSGCACSPPSVRPRGWSRGSPRSSRGIALGAWRAMTTLAFSAPLGATAQRRAGTVAAPHVLDANSLADPLDRLYRAALGLTGNPADAEDLVQDVCVRVLAKPRLVSGD